MSGVSQSAKPRLRCAAQRIPSALLVALLLGMAEPCLAADGDMVRLAGGTFTMGSDRGLADERPPHVLTLKPFWLDRRPVTNAEFAAFLQRIGDTKNDRGQHLFDWDDGDARLHKVSGQWRADAGYEDHPVNESSWFGARDFCAAQGKRLPSEAEWEFAARGSEGRTYPWGEAPPDPARARYGVGYGQAVAVGSLPDGATPEGVLDMAGNVHQWTASIAAPYPYRADDGREDPDRFADRVTRGGAADTRADTLRGTWRGASVSRGSRSGHHNIGFRCARDD
jgi:formylglycine-generating enzyme required for sulfatase activity